MGSIGSTVDVTGHGSFIVVLDDEGAIFGVRRGSVSTKVLEHLLAQRILDERFIGRFAQRFCP